MGTLGVDTIWEQKRYTWEPGIAYVSGVSEMVMNLGMNFLNAQMEITYCAFENDKYVSQSVRDYA